MLLFVVRRRWWVGVCCTLFVYFVIRCRVLLLLLCFQSSRDLVGRLVVVVRVLVGECWVLCVFWASFFFFFFFFFVCRV